VVGDGRPDLLGRVDGLVPSARIAVDQDERWLDRAGPADVVDHGSAPAEHGAG
jgi:hypothetical protein